MRVAPPEVADVVAEAVVPLAPAWSEGAELIPVRTHVPRLGDQLHLAQHRVVAERDLERVFLVHVVPLVPEQRADQVEAEPVDPHLGHPVAQRVEDHPQHARLGGVDGVAAAGDVVVVVLVVGEPVVAEVVQAAEGERRPLVAALTGVVVDHVEDHLDARGVQGRHHLLELPHLLAERAHRAVRGVRGEVAEGVVAPVVGQAATDQERLGHVVVNGQQLDRRDAEVDQVLHDRRVGQPRVRPAQVLRDGRVQPGVALDVQLVEDGLGQRGRAGDRLGRRDVADHDAQRDGGDRVPLVGDVVGLRGVVQDRAGVVHAAGDRAGVRVEQQLRRVEAGAGGGVPLAVHPVAVALLRADSRDVDGPDAVRAELQVVVGLGQVLVHQDELHPGRARRPEAEDRAAVTEVRTEHRRVGRDRQRRAGCHTRLFLGRS